MAKRFQATVTAGNTGSLVAAVPTKRLVVKNYLLTISTTGTFQFKSATTNITPAMPVSVGAAHGDPDDGVLETAAGEALQLAAVTGNVTIYGTYEELPPLPS